LDMMGPASLERPFRDWLATSLRGLHRRVAFKGGAYEG
jgi:hypothetical protein